MNEQAYEGHLPGLLEVILLSWYAHSKASERDGLAAQCHVKRVPPRHEPHKPPTLLSIALSIRGIHRVMSFPGQEEPTQKQIISQKASHHMTPLLQHTHTHTHTHTHIYRHTHTHTHTHARSAWRDVVRVGKIDAQKIRRVTSIPDPDILEKYRDTPPISIAILLQKYALPLAESSIYTTNLYHDTPPICIAILLQK